MAALTTGELELPDNIIDPWLGKVQYGSTIAALSASEPLKFGKGKAMVFDIGEAEYVGEGQSKGASSFTKTIQNTNPFKFHKTVRWTDEVKYADEDYQLGVLTQILSLIQPALSRALDFGVIHGINPATGATVSAMSQKLASASSVVTRATKDKPYANLDAADALVLANSYVPSDVALAPAYAGQFSALRGTQTEQRLYPDFKLTSEVSTLDNHRASVNRTVDALGIISAPSKISGIVGDFGAVRWGIQRSIGLEMIEYGDPDGQGDLKRNNQVAFRAEVIYGWGIADLKAFALIKDGE